MNKTCKDCGKPIYWADELGLWYHRDLAVMLACPAAPYVKPTEATA